MASLPTKVTSLTVPGLRDGSYSLCAFDTRNGALSPLPGAVRGGGRLRIAIGAVRSDVVIVARSSEAAGSADRTV